MRLKPLCISEEGSTLVLTSLGMVVIIAFVGLAIDVGNLRSVKRHLEAAADAAALAAALEATSCQGTNACSAMQTAAKSSMAENGFSVSTVLTNCSGTAGSGLTITVNNPPCAQGANDPNSGKTSYVEVIASETQPTYFASLVGFKNPMIAVRAEAKQTPNPNCVFALDPTGAAINILVAASVTATCGIVDESDASNALACNLLAGFSATTINIVGGWGGILCFSGSTPNTGVTAPVPGDPLSLLPKPSVPACGTSTGPIYHGSSSTLNLAAGTFTLYPDAAYCGGINILGANVTFMPGTYVIKSIGTSGGLSISLLSNVTGTGVTFYNYGPSGGITMLAGSATLGGVSLVAPTTGTYACILFFQDSGNTSPATILGTTSWNTVFQGAYYFPTASVSFAADLNVDYNFLVAKDITFALGTFANFSNNYSTIPNGCPLTGGGSVLVQ
jgi:Flp pilus assembly protein TadG